MTKWPKALQAIAAGSFEHVTQKPRTVDMPTGTRLPHMLKRLPRGAQMKDEPPVQCALNW